MTPDDVALVLDLLNTVDRELGTDILDEDAGYRAWCVERHLDAGSVADTRALRDCLRDTIEPGRTAHPALQHLQVVAVVTADGVSLASHDVIAATLLAASRITAAGAWSRVKLCPADDCGEAFFDRSRNHSRVWCDMAACGNVTKVRASRRRHAPA